MAVIIEERFIEIQPYSSDHKKEDPYNLTMAECLPSDLYFTISQVNGDEDYGDYDEDDDDIPPELYYLVVIGGGQDYDDDNEEFPYNLSMVECLGSDLHFAIFEDNNVEAEADFGMKEVCHAKASSDETEEVDDEEEENFWYGWYKICKFKRAKEWSRDYNMKLIKNRSSLKK